MKPKKQPAERLSRQKIQRQILRENPDAFYSIKGYHCADFIGRVVVCRETEADFVPTSGGDAVTIPFAGAATIEKL